MNIDFINFLNERYILLIIKNLHIYIYSLSILLQAENNYNNLLFYTYNKNNLIIQ